MPRDLFPATFVAARSRRDVGVASVVLVFFSFPDHAMRNEGVVVSSDLPDVIRDMTTKSELKVLVDNYTSIRIAILCKLAKKRIDPHQYSGFVAS